MSVKLASHAGFCFGVKRAVDLALNARKNVNGMIYTLGPLIHNGEVIKYLESENIYQIDLCEIDRLKPNDVIIIRSHGISLDDFNVLKSHKLSIIDATCPNVLNIQRKVNKYYNEGYSIVIVGDKTHPEVIGINGWCSNSALITRNGFDIINFPKKVCLVSQTTEKKENWDSVYNILKGKCEEFLAINTICDATKERQLSACELSKKVDYMVVIGDHHSSNTNKLYEICTKYCRNTYHIENSGEIPDFILRKNNKNIGVTAGASTPDWIIKEALIKMSDSENVNVNEEVNEQLDFMEKNSTTVSVGEKVKGAIISLNDKEAFVNINYKADGYLPKEEVTKDENAKLTDFFKVGDEVEAKIVSRRNEDGYVVLSRIELVREEANRFVKEAFTNKTVINVKMKEAVKGGLVANYKGVRIFIPASHVELYHVDDLTSYVGKELDINIIEYNEEKRTTKIIGSRRELLKKEREEKEAVAWEKIQADNTYEGEVKRLTDFGAFVDVEGVDGLLHVSEISWGRVNKPSDVLKVGDKINVYVLSIDKDKKKLSLSMKKLIEDPWNNVDEKYPVGNVVLGKVVRFASFGAFVELEPGVDALVHISQISHKRINKPGDALQIGEQVKAKILDVNKEDKKIGLSIKEVNEI